MKKEQGKAHHHRSSLKQKNKPFKGGSSARSESRGRVEAKKRVSVKSAADLNRRDRRNQQAQIQQQKRAELTTQRRLFSGREGMARIIAIIAVTTESQVDGLPFTWGQVSLSEKNKQNLQFIPCRRPSSNGMMEEWIRIILDAAQVADCLCFVVASQDNDFDDFGRMAFTMTRALGASSTTAIVQGLKRVQKHTSDQEYLAE